MPGLFAYRPVTGSSVSKQNMHFISCSWQRRGRFEKLMTIVCRDVQYVRRSATQCVYQTRIIASGASHPVYHRYLILSIQME